MRVRENGFSLAEAIVVLALLILVAAIAVPLLANTSSFARLRSDTYDISGKLTLAKFRAANELTAYRIRFDLATDSYQLERRCTDADQRGGLCAIGEFIPEGPVTTLRNSITYATTSDLAGYGSAPANGEQTSPPMQSNFIIFNSRGIPVDLTGRPLAGNAIYIHNTGKQSYAVTVSLSGLIEVWRYLPDGSWKPPE